MTVKSPLTMLRRAVFYGGTALSVFALSACAIEVGPPPESDPPLVPQAQKGPPPPAQPTEPQAWSRDLDFSTGPVLSDPEEVQEGLVAANADGVTYSKQRLTYQSAFNDEKPVSEAEQARQKARERAAAAGLPPPPAVSAAPVQSVSAEALPPAGGEQRESRLPPPPKFPPVPAQNETQTPTQEAAVPPPADEPSAAEAAPAEDPRWETSRLPPPPKFPTTLGEQAAAPESEDLPEDAAQNDPALSDAAQGDAAAAPAPEGAPEVAAAEEPNLLPETASGPETQVAAVPASETPVGETADFVAEAWNAPPGTILVQVSAVPNKASVPEEWQRLQGRFPEYLSPLRLVVDEARLGEKGVFYRVQAGAFGSQDGAAEVCDSLISRGQACFVVVR